MRDPLIKRLPREFRSDFGKYIVIFLFLVMLISLVSGFIVATDSMLAAYDEGFTKYNVEDGHITFDKEPPAELIEKLETKAGITLCPMWYINCDMGGDKTTRIYAVRDTVDTECLMSGSMPVNDSDIAIDRMFAANNDIKTGDAITANGRTLTVTGLCAFPDYSCLYESNTDMMFDALGFNVGVMTKSGFESINGRLHYNYAWKYNGFYDRNDKIRANELSEALIDTLSDVLTEYDEDIVSVQVDELKDKLEKAGEEYAKLYMTSGKAPSKEELSVPLSDFLFGVIEDSVAAKLNGEEYEMPAEEEFEGEIDKSGIIAVDDYVPQYVNQAINFTGTDMGGDKATFIVFSYIVIAVLAFIFAVTTSNTIVSDAGVIGTLRASGYSKGELTRHYLVLPVLITVIAALIGNILGYTYFKEVMADMYYNSYSLPTYVVLWNADAFLLTTAIPAALMFVINLAVIASKMRLTPLQFLRRELKKNPKKKAFRLNTKIPFITRFRIRIIFQNMSSYIVMIFGIILGACVIIFGEIFGTIFDDYTEMMIDSVICEYQYVLTDTVETENISAEKYSMTSFDFQYKDFMKDEVSVYGIEDNSRYVHADLKDGKVAVSDTVALKYNIGKGDSITLSDPYSRDKSYTFTVDSVYDYEASLSVFISRESFNKTFGKEADYFTGYFSNEELTDIDKDKVAGMITVRDFTKLSEQMEVSVGSFMKFFGYFGVIMFVLIMFILSKQVIERNFQSISMCKILGFKDGEISGLYIVSTSVAVMIGLLVSVPLADFILRFVFNNYLYKMMTGYFPYNVRPESYVKMVIVGVIAYAAVALLQMLKISRVQKGEALKNRE